MAWILFFILHLSSAKGATVRQNSTRQLRDGRLTPAAPKLLALLGVQSDICKCTFEDQCSCQGALRFMDCVKNACNSGLCQCIEKDGTNHFMESCSALADECPSVGMKCAEEQATCNEDRARNTVAWHSKVKQHAVEDKHADEEDKAAKVPSKYVSHTRLKAVKREMHSRGHLVFTQSIVATLIVLCLAIALASSANDIIVKQTWSMIDSVVATFLAVLWFILVLNGLDYFRFTKYMSIGVHALILVFFLLSSILVSYSLRNDELSLLRFNGIFTPMVMWCSVGFVETVQKQYASSQLALLFIFFVLLIWYALLNVLIGGKKLADDAKNQMTGAGLASAFVLLVHTVISGNYQAIEGPNRTPPSYSESLIMLGLSVLYLTLAVLSTPSVSRSVSSAGSYWRKRVNATLLSFIFFLPRLSLALSVANLIIDNMGYPPGDMSARVALILVNIAIGLFMIAVCAYVPMFKKQNSETAEQLSQLLVGLGGFVVGMAWAGLLDNSINMMSQGKGYASAFMYKLGIVVILTSIIFPVYYLYLKPLIMVKAAVGNA